jgi:hypothetical protein
MRIFTRLPTRRFELLVTLLLTLACIGLAGYVGAEMDERGAALIIIVTLEIILPVGMGLLAAGLLAGDPALDILLSAHRPARQVLVERLLLIAGAAVLFAWVALSLAAHWRLPLPREGSAQLYFWLSPLVFNLGLGSAVSLLRGKMLDGALAVLAVMGISLMLLPQIPRLCAANPPGVPCIGWLASPLMTLGSPGDAYWPLNRLVWLFLGIGLLALSQRLACREEPLLHEAAAEQ